MKSQKVRQHYSYDCGAACLASVAAFYGIRHSLAHIRMLCGCTPEGISIQGMIDGASKMGLVAKGYRSLTKDLSPLMEINAPVIAHIKDEQGGLHFITIFDIGKDKIKIMDPAKGEVTTISHPEFAAMWTGYIVTITPGAISGNRGAVLTPFIHHLLALLKSHSKEMLLSFAGSTMCIFAGLGTTFLLQQLIDKVIPQQNFSAMVAVGVLAFLLMGLSLYIGYCTTRYLIRCSLKIETSLISQYITRIMELPAGFFANYRSGDLTARTDDIHTIRSFITEGTVGIISSTITSAGAFAVMLIYDIQLALYISLSLPLYYILYVVSRNITQKYSRQIASANSTFESQIIESIGCSAIARHYGAQHLTLKKMEKAIVTLMEKLNRSANAVNMLQTSVQGVSKTLVCMIFTIGSASILKGEMSIGELVGFYTLCSFFTVPVNSLIESSELVSKASVSFERVFEILNLPLEEMNSDGISPIGLKGNICLHNACFRFPGRGELFNNLSFTVPEGKITLLQGESGCGKSTIAQMLLCEYQATNGYISYAGVNIAQMNLKEWRGMIGYVPQNPVLFNASIMDNITLEDASPNIDKVLEICSSLGLDKLVESSSDGLLTLVGENGRKMSGGECQRLCIARAMYKDPQIYIMDEITSALDPSNERLVMNILENLKSMGKTILLISHKRDGHSIADNVVTIKGNEPAQSGNLRSTYR